jgi:uncharacterized membrane protein YbhN (UPF0104 family)
MNARTSGDEEPRASSSRRSRARAVALRAAFLLVTLLALYVLWPSLLSVLSSFPELRTIRPWWFAVLAGLEVASFACAWALQRMALRSSGWFGIATAQLAGNAVSRVVPGGAAAGGAVQYRMLVKAGVDPTQVGTGLTAASLVSAATLFALPILSVPAVLAGRPVPSGLAEAAWLGAGVFVAAFAIGGVLLRVDRALLGVGRAVQWTINRLPRPRGPTTDLPARLLVERNEVRRDLGKMWAPALLSALGNWLFDYLALLATLAAVGSFPRPSLVLLAYVASMVLAMIPITPGGLGFVEAGLTALLVVAGVDAGKASVSVLAYRLVSFWLPIPAGGVAALLYRRRYGEPVRST